MGDDELVEIKLAKGLGERVVTLERTKGYLKKVAPIQLLEEALQDPTISEEDKRELALMKTATQSGVSPTAEYFDEHGAHRLAPFEKKDVTHYVNEFGGKPVLSLDYGSKQEIGL